MNMLIDLLCDGDENATATWFRGEFTVGDLLDLAEGEDLCLTI